MTESIDSRCESVTCHNIFCKELVVRFLIRSLIRISFKGANIGLISLLFCSLLQLGFMHLLSDFFACKLFFQDGT